MTILVLSLGSLPALCNDNEKKDQIKIYYEHIINEKINRCHSKAQLKESKSTNLQNCALMEIKKANYFTANKEMLINEMVKINIGVKKYKIEYFLNSKFYENSGILHEKKHIIIRYIAFRQVALLIIEMPGQYSAEFGPGSRRRYTCHTIFLSIKFAGIHRALFFA